jgi:predicted ATP-grasp superfamily ATP-dependent carboligase
MHLFVYEYLSSGAAETASDRTSLQTEGWAILWAVVEDLARCLKVRISTLLDSRRTPPRKWSDRVVVQQVRPSAEEDTFRTLAAEADWTLVIAPEFDDILAERTRWVVESGGRLLGCSPEAIHETSDKQKLSQMWTARGIPTPSLEQTYPLVFKPRFGAGSQATFLVHDNEELRRALTRAAREGWRGEMILQRYAPGVAASVAFLGGSRQRRTLPAVEQRLSCEGRFRYLGGCLPLQDFLDRRARNLAERAVECVEGLHGWFGVDLVLGDEADGSGDVAIEINPRLTTSYLGLRRLARFNLAEALLAVATDAPTSLLTWGTETIDFDANGGA